MSAVKSASPEASPAHASRLVVERRGDIGPGGFRMEARQMATSRPALALGPIYARCRLVIWHRYHEDHLPPTLHSPRADGRTGGVRRRRAWGDRAGDDRPHRAPHPRAPRPPPPPARRTGRQNPPPPPPPTARQRAP